MRIRFATPGSSEAAEATALYARADTFFTHAIELVTRRFASARAPAEHAALERALVTSFDDVSDGIVVEVDGSEEDGLRIVLAPAGDSGLEPFLAELLKRAPSRPGLRFVRYRGEKSVDEAVSEVRRGFGLDLSSARLRIGFSRGHLLEVVVHSSAFSNAADGPGLDAANLLVLRLIGDELFDDWVGAVEIAPAPRDGPLRLFSDATGSSPLALAEALPAVEAAIRGVYAGLPEEPLRTSSDEAKWTLFEIEPGAEPDYAAQDDVALTSTSIPEGMKCFLEGGRFSSKRFSRHGESFAYVKIDAWTKSPDARHELRVRLEDVVGRVLVAHAIGCVVGAGLGVRYVYLDVVLENLEHGVRLLRETLRDLDVDRRSWILFFDSALSREWVGIWDDTPPPPSR